MHDRYHGGFDPQSSALAAIGHPAPLRLRSYLMHTPNILCVVLKYVETVNPYKFLQRVLTNSKNLLSHRP